MNGMDYIKIFRGDDSDALGYQTIVGTIKTDLDLTGCRAIFRYLGFFQEFDPIPEDSKLTIVIPAQSSRGFPPGVGYASLKVYDPLGKVRTFTNRIPVIVDAMTPMCPCGGNFEVSFSPFPELEPLKIFVGPGADDFDEYTGFLSKIIDRASLEKYGLTILADAMGEDGGATGKAASPLAVKAAYDAIIKELTDNYYTAQETDEAIDKLAAYYITYNAAGAAFPTRADLINAQTYYSGGAVRNPTRNDYAVVLADETHDGAEYRYIYAVADGATTGEWQAQYPVGGVMTIDQSVTKNSANPVSSSGIWSAIWGALTALPTGFASLYDWVVDQLAGKASKADATLTARYGSTEAAQWTITYPQGWAHGAVYITWFDEFPPIGWVADCDGDRFGPFSDNPNATTLTGEVFGETITATRTALPGYQLGNDDQHILASEAEAEALRTDKADKPTTSTNNNLAALDANGNLKDSGKTPADFATAEQGGRADAVFGLFEEVPGYDIPAIRLAGFRVPWGVAGYIEFGNGGVHFYHPAGQGQTGVDYTTEWPFKTGKFATTSDIPDVSAKANASAVAPEFDATASYAVGDIVMHEGTRYKCTTAHSGAWAAADFTEEDVQTALENGGGGGTSALVYDAELEYLTVPAGSGFVLPVNQCNQNFVMSVKMRFDKSQMDSSHSVLMGNWRGVIDGSVQIFSSGTDTFGMINNSISNTSISNIPSSETFFTATINGTTGYIDSTARFSFNAAYNYFAPKPIGVGICVLNDGTLGLGTLGFDLAEFTFSGPVGDYDFVPVRKDGVAYLFERNSHMMVPITGSTPATLGPDKENAPQPPIVAYDTNALPYSLGTPTVINTAYSGTVEGETVYYGAATLANRTANIVQVTAATALDELRITFPAATSGKVRDFGLRVEIGTGSAALAAPALVPIAPTGETIKIENSAAEIPALADGTATAKGVTLLYFSETAPGVFVVKGEQVEEVA